MKLIADIGQHAFFSVDRGSHRQRVPGGCDSVYRAVPTRGMCIVRRMPRMQVYLPDDLYAEVKEQGLPASELLQDVVREQMRKRKLIEEGEKYLEELRAEVGEPTPEVKAWVKEVLAPLDRRNGRVAS